ncbi:hypothetical protein, partial [Gallibacterium genomosp. 2]|uniref:hypothetical protein n=1 Tax=Gallibacterium genomosp. 2 TaxID=155517 RepID=UPI001AE0CDC8
ALWQNGQFFTHISKRGLKALYYKALSHFLATILSTMPTNFNKLKLARIEIDFRQKVIIFRA